MADTVCCCDINTRYVANESVWLCAAAAAAAADDDDDEWLILLCRKHARLRVISTPIRSIFLPMGWRTVYRRDNH